MDLVAALIEEERVLQEKLEAVRRTLAVYRHGNGNASIPTQPPSPTSRHRPSTFTEGVVERASLPRLDRFGTYGTAIVEKSIKLLPDHHGRPVMTRDLVELLEREGMPVRGSDKVNALSAMLARSSRLKAHGRRGWTRSEPVAGVNAYKENEPSSGHAAGSDAADAGAPPPNSASEHSNSPARGS